MIINFSIKNFQSIKDKITLSFEATRSDDLEDYYIIEPKKGLRLLKLGLIYGANASGKTTILKALDFLRTITIKPFEKKIETFNIKPFLFDDTSFKKDTFFSIEFIQNKVKYLYEIQLNKNAVIKEVLYFHKPNKALVFKRKTNVSKELTEITFGNKIKINKQNKIILEANTLWNNSVLGGYLKTNIESNELQEVINWFGYKLKPIIYPDISLFSYTSDKLEKDEIEKKNIIEILKKADFGISDILIEVENIKIDEDFIKIISKESNISKEEIEKMKKAGKIESKEIIFQHSINKKNYTLPFNDESAGTKRYYGFSGLLNLIITQESIFTIDELESSLHPDLIKHFILTFLVNSKESQIITTTHYRELLKDKDILRKDVIWFTEKKEDGSTDLFSLSNFKTSTIRDTSSIYNAYKIGKFGAVPNLNDYYLDFKDEKE